MDASYESTYAQSVRQLIETLINSGIRREDALLKGYDAALMLVTDGAHRPSQQGPGGQPLPARAILHSAMRVYIIASGEAEE